MPAPSSSLYRSLLSPRFLLCAVILALASVCLRPGMAALGRHYSKQSIPLRRSLTDLDITKLPSFKKAVDSKRLLMKETSNESLGTDEVARCILQEKSCYGQEGHVSLLVTYYSDPEDQVPHTPDVCYRQGGAVVLELATTTVSMPELAPENPTIKLRKVAVRDPGCEYGIILYTFCASGEFACDREQVRLINAMPGNRHLYFSKIEAATPAVEGEDRAAAEERCKRLLREAILVLLADHFPTREDLKGR